MIQPARRSLRNDLRRCAATADPSGTRFPR